MFLGVPADWLLMCLSYILQLTEGANPIGYIAVSGTYEKGKMDEKVSLGHMKTGMEV